MDKVRKIFERINTKVLFHDELMVLKCCLFDFRKTRNIIIIIFTLEATKLNYLYLYCSAFRRNQVINNKKWPTFCNFYLQTLRVGSKYIRYIKVFPGINSTPKKYRVCTDFSSLM